MTSRWLSERLSDLSTWLMRLSLAVRPHVSDEEFIAACERVNQRTDQRCWKDGTETCSHPSYCDGWGCQL